MGRGNMRGNGRTAMRGGLRGAPYKKVFVPRHPFDMPLAEVSFPKVNGTGSPPVTEDSALTNALLKRNADLTPTPAELTSIGNLVAKVQAVLDNIVVASGDFQACQLDEVRQVGSFKKGTMVTGSNTADIVAILQSMPTRTAVQALSAKVLDDLRNVMKTEVVAKSDVLHVDINPHGFDVHNQMARVRILVTTLPANFRKLDSNLHCDLQRMQAHLAAIRHSRWFEENAHHSSIKVLIRLLRDMTKRFQAFAPLSPWMLDLLAHFAIMHNPSRQALPINLAFRRVFQLLAAGLFLPGSAGISDPCETGHLRVHTALTLEQQDVCCLTAQTLLRVLTHGGYKHILGLEGNASIAREMSVWDGVVVSPLQTVYEKHDSKADELQKDDDEDSDEDDGEGDAEDALE